MIPFLSLQMITITCRQAGPGPLPSREREKNKTMSILCESLKNRIGYLPIIAGTLNLICGIYCMVWWESAYPLTFYQPDIGITCWLYCSTMNPWLGAVNLLAGVILILGGSFLLTNRNKLGAYFSLISGIATFPIGLLGIFAGFYAIRINPPNRN